MKADEVLSDGEIILFTTKEHLKILARAHQILEDGDDNEKLLITKVLRN